MTAFGIDYAFDRPDSPRALVNSGVTFVCRYLSGSWKDNSKDISPDEARALSAAGLEIALVWELGAGRARDGLGAGRSDATAALREAGQVGMPSDRPIYLAVDEDVSGASVDAYFRGANSVAGVGRTGAYGSYAVVKYLFDKGLIRFGWQTYAWSGGAWDRRAQLQQYSNDHTVGGVSCDYDRALAPDFGQWRVGWSPSALPVLGRPGGGRTSRGPWIISYTKGLIFLGYLRGAPRSYFTKGTEKATRAFQKNHARFGLKETGIVDNKTLSVFRTAVRYRQTHPKH